MYEPALPSLAEWESFCVIVGSSAAALTGLMFVVIALRADRRSPRMAEQFSAFATPTVIHFCSVLLVISVLCMPRHTLFSLSLLLGGIGLLGVGLSCWVYVRARKQDFYKMVPEDWVFHVAVPGVGYGALFASAIALWHYADPALYAVASSTLILLFVGIHNAWDAAVFLAGDPLDDHGKQK